MLISRIATYPPQEKGHLPHHKKEELSQKKEVKKHNI
jgi:hypothetical protein